jgi:hypothetical protein
LNCFVRNQFVLVSNAGFLDAGLAVAIRISHAVDTVAGSCDDTTVVAASAPPVGVDSLSNSVTVPRASAGGADAVGRWYPGRVTGCSSTTGYSIAYQDGSRETGVQPARVRATRVVRCTRTTFRVGQRVQGNYRGGGRWYHGIVRAARNCKYSIQYCDNDRETNVAQTNVRDPQGRRPSNCRV